MNKDIMHFKYPVVTLGLLSAMVLVAGFTIVPKAHAESPNILTGENLTIGSTGQGVVVLQGLLQELGYLTIPVGTRMGYFGQATKAGLARYQAAQSVSPAVGYFGPVSKVAMHQEFLPKGWLTLLGW